MGTYGPSAELEADWTPNPINLNWYDGNQQLTVPSAATGCTYDQGITLPSEPTKTGYRFGGWRVREAPSCDLSSYDTSVNAVYDSTHTRWKALNGSSGLTMTSEGLTENSNDLSNGEWALTFDYGTVYGRAKCHSSMCGNNDNFTYVNPTFATDSQLGAGTSGTCCWCAVTGFLPNGGSMCEFSSSSYVFYNREGYSTCVNSCAGRCAQVVRQRQGMRTALWGAAQ